MLAVTLFQTFVNITNSAFRKLTTKLNSLFDNIDLFGALADHSLPRNREVSRGFLWFCQEDYVAVS
jgi:hypothetical protein